MRPDSVAIVRGTDMFHFTTHARITWQEIIKIRVLYNHVTGIDLSDAGWTWSSCGCCKLKNKTTNMGEYYKLCDCCWLFNTVYINKTYRVPCLIDNHHTFALKFKFVSCQRNILMRPLSKTFIKTQRQKRWNSISWANCHLLTTMYSNKNKIIVYYNCRHARSLIPKIVSNCNCNCNCQK